MVFIHVLEDQLKMRRGLACARAPPPPPPNMDPKGITSFYRSGRRLFHQLVLLSVMGEHLK